MDRVDVVRRIVNGTLRTVSQGSRIIKAQLLTKWESARAQQAVFVIVVILSRPLVDLDLFGPCFLL